MTRIPMHAPPAAPAVLVSESATGGLAVLGALVAAGCAAATLGLLAGPAPQPGPPGPTVPVSAASGPDVQVPDPLPPRPGQPVPSTATPPAAVAAPVGAPVPGWRRAPADAASVVPDVDPRPADPAVEQALARLRVAPADADGRRPGVAALTALDHVFDQVGDPYVWGATGPDTFDCSGLTQWAYRAAGVFLPRVSRDQFATGGELVDVDDLLPGDLVFFATAAWDPGVVHHVGMYAGAGLMVAAPRPGLTVRVEPMSAQGYVGAIRPVPAREPAQDKGGRPERPGHRARPTIGAGPGPAASAPSPSPSPAAGLPSLAPADPVPPPAVGPTPSAEPDPTATPTTTDAPVTTAPTPDPSVTPTLPVTDLPPDPARGTG